MQIIPALARRLSVWEASAKVHPKTAVAFRVITIFWKPSVIWLTRNVRTCGIGLEANSTPTHFQSMKSIADSPVSNATIKNLKPRNTGITATHTLLPKALAEAGPAL
jgi:hypothetical protein